MFDDQIIIEAGKAAEAKEIGERVRQTSSALRSWQKIKDTAGSIADEGQRLGYLHESLEAMSMNDLIATAGACNAGLL